MWETYNYTDTIQVLERNREGNIDGADEGRKTSSGDRFKKKAG